MDACRSRFASFSPPLRSLGKLPKFFAAFFILLYHSTFKVTWDLPYRWDYRRIGVIGKRSQTLTQNFQATAYSDQNSNEQLFHLAHLPIKKSLSPA
ncbi:hypothetical protein AVEN_38097-1 [Araneus ventricosus]|uniref:Uncharacterized protein n=1 Tax=Araneus ventricosus TaxID=182803 RepID=A0A4Y2GBF3_ARAVE|nr:hypothetical protein AVEN_38097-1 [Araneus ventricosus]